MSMRRSNGTCCLGWPRPTWPATSAPTAGVRLRRAGHPCALSAPDQLLLTVVWLRQYPTHDVLALLFDLGAATTVGRTIARVLPVLEAAGQATMRMPDPGRRHRRTLAALLADTPVLAVIVDSFEQRVQRPKDRRERDDWYSGKKKAHTIKSQVAVDEDTGHLVDVAESVPGPTADITLLDRSRLLTRLRRGWAVSVTWVT